jgi:membrane protein
MSLPPFLKRLYNEFAEDRIPAVAAGITFFFLLALFPAIASVVSLYGLLADRHSIMQVVQMASGFLPEGGVRVLRSDLYRLVSQDPDKLGWAFAFGFLVAIWSASGGIKALLDGLNVAFETRESRSFLVITRNALLGTLVAIMLAAAAIFILITGSQLLGALPFQSVLAWVFRILAWPAGFCLCSLIISLIYRFGPNRPGARWHWISWGSTFASVAWMLGTLAFGWYAAHFGSYDRTYGELGAVVGFLTWIWLSLVILLLGAEIVCECERSAPRRQRKMASRKKVADRQVGRHHGQIA